VFYSAKLSQTKNTVPVFRWDSNRAVQYLFFPIWLDPDLDGFGMTNPAGEKKCRIPAPALVTKTGIYFFSHTALLLHKKWLL